MTPPQHPAAPHYLPWFVTPPGETDTLYVITTLVVIVSVILLGVMFFWLHSLPERMGHKKMQFEIVAVLGLISLFTHMHIFWIIGLLLALIDLPDIMSPLRRIADSAGKIAGIETVLVPGTQQPLPGGTPSGHDNSVHSPQGQIEKLDGGGVSKKSILIFAGVAILAIGTIFSVTLDRWMRPSPETSAPIKITVSEQPAIRHAAEEAPAMTAPAPEPATPDGVATRERPVAEPAPATRAANPAEVAIPELSASQPQTTSKSLATEQPMAQPESEPNKTTEQPAPVVEAKQEPPSIDTVRVDKPGDAVITGRATVGSEVTVKLDGMPIGKATANAGGTFVLIPDAPLASGSGTLTVESRTANQSTALVSNQTVTVTLPAVDKGDAFAGGPNIDTTAGIHRKPEPAVEEPAESSAEPARKTVFANVAPEAAAQDREGNITFSGRASTRSKARPNAARGPTVRAATTSSYYGEQRRPYWIEENCDERDTNCDPRMRYAPGENPSVIDPNGYWYGIPKRLRHSSYRDNYNLSKHVRWCKAHYHTYNAKTDQFVGKDHKHKRCNSPFSVSASTT